MSNWRYDSSKKGLETVFFDYEVEELKYLWGRARGKWAFNQLRAFIEYKAKLAGVPVVMVDPRDTSRRCSGYGRVEGCNRVSQSLFRCHRCGFEMNADLNAAKNIQWRAGVNQPIVVCPDGSLNYKPIL